jgi:hypothetical protein
MFCMYLPFMGLCKVLPTNRSVVNCTRIYFEEELHKGAGEYELVFFDSLPNGSRAEIKKIKGRLPAFIINGFEWDHIYYWYVKGYDLANAEMYTGDTHTFKVMKVVSQNSEEFRIAVKVNKKNKQAGGYIAVDYTRSIYDREGKALWTIPDAEHMSAQQNQIRDLKITKDNTVTFLNGSFPLEIDLDGNILWMPPYPFIFNSDTIVYHHDFKKTNRGTYMVMGNRKVYRKALGDYSAEALKKEFETRVINNQVYCRVQVVILLEFNREGKLIWYWDSNEYIEDADLNFKKSLSKLPSFATHANAFSENEAGTKVYLGFRDLSRIIKIDKKTGKVELSYGEKYPSGEARLANHLFRRQHDARVTKHNSILIFNNNSNPGQGPGGISSVMELKDNAGINDSILLWKFSLDFDTLTAGRSVSGGNLNELPNSNLLVCAGLLNRIFEVTRGKEIVWDAFIESRKMNGITWQASPQYRCSWTPGIKLFRCIPEVISHTVKNNQVSFDLAIHNTGDSDDVYQVEVFSRTGISLHKLKTQTVRKNKTLKQNMKFKLNPAGVNEVSVMVRSLSSLEQNNFTVAIK